MVSIAVDGIDVGVYGFALYYFIYIFYSKNGPLGIFLSIRGFAKKNSITAIRCDVCFPYWISLIGVVLMIILSISGATNLVAIIDAIVKVFALNGLLIFLRKMTGDSVSADPEAKKLDYE